MHLRVIMMSESVRGGAIEQHLTKGWLAGLSIEELADDVADLDPDVAIYSSEGFRPDELLVVVDDVPREGQ
ncbi:hypothetical protein [Azospirillum sp. B510]|uniref:hypothetical protein n=1 Tax=Azospirillum sp. (strain B510) TaxID=137722 RepID=UPI0002FF6661|nr:hypothetical protein [Azospirillum sp. B510]